MRLLVKLVLVVCLFKLPLFAQEAAFPEAIATPTDLLVAKNSARGALADSIGPTDTTLTLTSAGDFAAGMALAIQNEIIKCDTLTGNVFSDCERHYDSTTAVGHVRGQAVVGIIPAAAHNLLVSEIVAIETALGIELGNVGSGGTRGLTYYGAFASLPDAASVTNGLAVVNNCSNDACSSGGGSLIRLLVDTGSAWVAQPAGTLTNVTITGTSNQITATGTCSGTVTITCAFSIPSAFTLPGTINGMTLTTSSGTFTLSNSKTFTVLKSLTLDGTDGVTITFPASSATVATLGLTNTFTGRQDASSAASTAPAKVGTSLPGTCSVGDQYFKSDATAGSNLYGCTSTNTWTVQAGVSGGVSSATGTSNEISVSASTGAVTFSLASIVNLTTKTFRLPNSTSLPGTCAVGDLYMDTDATSGRRLYACESTNTWVLQGDGNSGGSAVFPFTVVRTSSTVLTIGTECTTSNPCPVRFGNTVTSLTTSATATISGSGSGTAYLYWAPGGTLTVGHNVTVTCSGCTATGSITSFPSDAIPVYTWTATTGTWDTSGGSDKRAFLSSKNIIGGTGINSSESSGATTVAVDTSAIPTLAGTNTFSGRQDLSGAASTAPSKVGTSLPGTCSVGDQYFKSDATAGQNLYACTSTNTWTAQAGAAAGVSSLAGTSNEITMSASTGAVTASLSSIVNLTSKTFRLPNSTSRPGTCAVGDAYMDTDATTGQRFYLCESTNTWVVQGDGNTGGGGTPGGSNTQCQYNNSSAFGGISGCTTNGAVVTLTSPVLVTPALGTPASGVGTNLTGTATGFTAGATNALKSATTSVDTLAATAPSAGQVLTATDSTHATWQAPSAGGGLSGASAIDFASLVDGACSDQTYTLTGLVAGSTLAIGLPSSISAGFTATAIASATNTAKIRLCNQSGETVDLSSLTFSVTHPTAIEATSTINFASLVDGACSTNTFTLTGAAAGTRIIPGFPAALESGLIGNMRASATDTITVQLCNFSGTTLDPASGTFSAAIQ